MRRFTFTSPSGTRAYSVFDPPRSSRQPLPLLLMLHGGAQDGADFALGTCMNEVAVERGFVVVYPEQSLSANSGRYWNWFQTTNQTRSGGEPAILAGIVHEVAARLDVDRRRVFAAGLSAGGAMAAVLAATHPDLFAAVGVHSGLAYGAARDLPSALTAMRRGAPARGGCPLPLIVFHGDRDPVVSPANAGHLIDSRLSTVRSGTVPLPTTRLREAAKEPAKQQVGRPAAQPAGRSGDTSPVRLPRPDSGRRAYTRTCYPDAGGGLLAELVLVHGSGHAWSGGSRLGSSTDPAGPDASALLVNFFLHATARSRLQRRTSAPSGAERLSRAG